MVVKVSNTRREEETSVYMCMCECRHVSVKLDSG